MNPPSALHSAMGREKKPFSYLPGGLDLSQIKSERMAQRLMRNAMNQGVPEVPVQPIQSPPTPSTPVAVPNFSCLPVQVLPPGFSLPANPKSLLRSRSNPNRDAPQKAPQFMNPQPIPQARIEQLQNNINKTVPQLPQTNISYNNRPTSMFEYGYSPNNATKTNYGSDGYTSPALPEMCYEAEYLTTAPKSSGVLENKEHLPLYSQDNFQPKEVSDRIKPELTPSLSETNPNVTSYETVGLSLPSNESNDIQEPVFSEISNSTAELNIQPISFDHNNEENSHSTPQNVNTSHLKSTQDIAVDLCENTNSDFVVKLPDYDDTILVLDPLEIKPAEDLSESSDDQKQVKVVKKQVKKEKKVEESATNVEDQNGNQNGDNEAELVVKLPTKKSGTKVETKVEVMKKSLPDGSVEETTKTTTKTTTDGKTSIKTKTETRIIPKDELSEEEVEEEDEDVEEEEEEEPQPVVVKENGHKEVIVKKAESTVTTTAKKVVVVESNDHEEGEEEEEEEEVVEPVKETVVKAAVKEEVKQEEVQEANEEEDQEKVVIVKKTAPAPVVNPEPEPEQQEEEEEEEEEAVVVVKKAVAVENKPIEVAQKDEEEEEEVEEEEEYEEAEEEVKGEVKKPEPKPEPVVEKPKEQEEDSEYTEEEVESEQDEAPKPVSVEKKETEPEPKPEPEPEPKLEPKPEPQEEKPDSNEEKPEDPQRAVPEPETKVPLREPSIPLEKVEDIEIKPIGDAQTVSKTLTQNTEIITSAAAPASSLSTQTEYNRVENIVTVNRTTKTLDNTYEQMTQSGIPTMKTYFAPNRERVSTSPQPTKPYQPTYTPPDPPKTERRHSLLLERLSTERQMPGSEVYQNNYSSQYTNQSYEQQKQWSQQEPQSEVVNVSNVKPSKISNSQWYQQSRCENVLYNNVTPTAVPPSSQLWNQQQQPQTQPQYQPSFTQSTQQDYSKVSNTYQQSSYPSYTPQPSSWGNSNLSTVNTIPSINVQSNQSYSSQETQSYQKTSQQYSSSYVPPPWEQDPNYVSPATSSFFQPSTDVAQPPPATNTFSPNTHPGWTSTLPKSKFSKPPPKAYVPPAPNQSFVKNVNIAEPPPQPGRKTYYSEYERRYITVPESNYVPAENKFQAQPDPSPQYYYDNNEQPAEPVEPQWRKELREFTEKTSQTQYQTQQTSVNPPWESEPNYGKNPTVTYTPTPSWSQTLRPQSYRERSFESELVSESQDWAKSNTLGRNRPLSSYVKSAEAPAPERARGVSVDRFNPNSYSGPLLSEHQPVQVQTLTPANAPHSKGYHNPNVPAYHARASAEPREQPAYQPRAYAPDSRASPLQSRSFKYLQWITGTDE